MAFVVFWLVVIGTRSGVLSTFEQVTLWMICGGHVVGSLVTAYRGR